MVNIAFPYDFDRQGLTATAIEDDHVRQMIDQLLFTSPGERVNRPTFGSGLMQLVFSPNSEQLAAALHASTQAGLQQWLGDVIEVHNLEVVNEDSRLYVLLDYSVVRTDERRTDTFVREVQT